MQRNRRVRPSKSTRRGSLTIELLFAAPIMILLLLAAVAYSQMSIIRSGVSQAVTVAAREAGKGAHAGEVTAAVNRILSTCGLRISHQPGSGAKVILQDGTLGVSQYGDPNLTCSRLPQLRADEVLATVWIKADGNIGKGSLLGYLGGIALAMQGNEICVSSLVKKSACGG